MNLLRRSSTKPTTIGGTIGYFNLQDWWTSAFTPDERNYIDHVFQPWGEQPHLLTQGTGIKPQKTLASHLSEITKYLRCPEDLYLIRRILGKAEEVATVQGDIKGLDAVYSALMNTLHTMASNERYHTSLAHTSRTRWH